MHAASLSYLGAGLNPNAGNGEFGMDSMDAIKDSPPSLSRLEGSVGIRAEYYCLCSAGFGGKLGRVAGAGSGMCHPGSSSLVARGKEPSSSFGVRILFPGAECQPRMHMPANGPGHVTLPNINELTYRTK